MTPEERLDKLAELLVSMDATQKETDNHGEREIAWYYYQRDIERALGVPPGALDSALPERRIAPSLLHRVRTGPTPEHTDPFTGTILDLDTPSDYGVVLDDHGGPYTRELPVPLTWAPVPDAQRTVVGTIDHISAATGTDGRKHLTVDGFARPGILTEDGTILPTASTLDHAPYDAGRVEGVLRIHRWVLVEVQAGKTGAFAGSGIRRADTR